MNTLSIAIIGMAGRFPGAKNLSALWENLRDGVESISFFNDETLEMAGVNKSWLSDPNYVKARGVLDDIDLFDAEFFRMNPQEADITDPQHRIFLECAWEALEHSGYANDKRKNKIGLFAGTSASQYLLTQLALGRNTVHNFQLLLANDKDFLTSRVAYKLNLRGPAVSVQTACSSSLVAVHLACQSLLAGECDITLAGGVAIGIPQISGYFYDGGINSPDGHCRAFDSQARGTVGGSGVGIVALKRMTEALEDRDQIHGLILGSAINNDGSLKVGYTAPSVEGQARVIADALAVAEADPSTITYLEAHGTGTTLGDPIEIAALNQVYKARTDKRAYCAIGSVKTNIGHLDAAAGVAGLIKTALSLNRRQIPPSLHFKEPNPKIDFEDSPFYVNARLREWDSEGGPRRAGVSSFGIGGTNAHLVLEEAPERVESGESRRPELLTLSARNDRALEQMRKNLSEHLAEHPQEPLADVAYTLKVGRKDFEKRYYLVCESRSAAREGLLESGELREAKEGESRSLVYVFSGQGTQYVGMGKELYDRESVFREAVDRCAVILEEETGRDLREIVFAAEGKREEAARELNETRTTQPALFVIEYALVELLRSWGLRPAGMIGHSVGEYVAACVSGVMGLEESLKAVARRGELMQRMPRGAMLSALLSVAELERRLVEGVEVAAENGPEVSVASGSVEAIGRLEKRLEREGVAYKRLKTSHGFHSWMMEEASREMEKVMREVRLREPEIGVISNVSGRWLRGEEAKEAGYWGRQLRGRVRFWEGIKELLREPGRVLMEIGVGSGVRRIVRQAPGREKVAVSWTLPKEGEGGEHERVIRGLGEVWAGGIEVDWEKYYQGEERNRVALPTYPFQRRRYWAGKSPTGAQDATVPNRVVVQDANENSAEIQVNNRLRGLPIEQESKQEASIMPQAHLPQTNENRSYIEILKSLRSVAISLTGLDEDELSNDKTFFESGVDSLLLIQFNRAVEEKFQIKLELKLLFEELTTLNALASHLDRQGVQIELPPSAADVGQAVAPAGDGTPLSVLVNPESPQSRHLRLIQEAQTDLQTTSLPAQPLSPQIFQVQQAMLYDNPAVKGGTAMEQLFSQQLQIISHQLSLLGRNGHSQNLASGSQAQSPEITVQPPQILDSAHTPAASAINRQVSNPSLPNLTASSSAALGASQTPEPYNPHRPHQIAPNEPISEKQLAHLQEIISRHSCNTKTSKSLIQQYRARMADTMTSNGFRSLWKELVYPIVAERAKGSEVYDVDGNRYVDITMGFGVHLLGHAPDCVVEALQRAIATGFPLGVQSKLAGEVAELICDFSGMERATFCNSGTEAVMAAIRLARTVRRRNKIAMFAGAYHGWSDLTLARKVGGQNSIKSFPLAPGIPEKFSEEIVVLDYGSPESLKLLRTLGNDLAAVLVEPVQSRRPDLQPKEFLHELRRITSQTGAVLIFDEIITGFRIHPGGCQAWFDVKADLAIYGKVIGGGLPIGMVAGTSALIDAIDGGYWDYADDSYPSAEKTLVAGTFCKHPLAMRTAQAILTRLKEKGPSLQEELNRSASQLVDSLNQFCSVHDIPARFANFGSLFRVMFLGPQRWSSLFYYLALSRGLLVLDGGNFFLSTAHTPADLEFIAATIEQSLLEMMREGWLSGHKPGSAPDLTEINQSGKKGLNGAQAGVARENTPTETRGAPLTEGQKELWVLIQLGDDACRAFNESVSLHLHGKLDKASLCQAIQKLVNRHEALRVTFSPDGASQHIRPQVLIDIPFEDFSETPEDEAKGLLETRLQEEANELFDLIQGPVIRAKLFKLGPEYHVCSITLHHILSDGWSFNILLRDLAAIYSAEKKGAPLTFSTARRLSDYALKQEEALHQRNDEDATSYWSRQLSGATYLLQLPNAASRPAIPSYKGIKMRTWLPADLTDELIALSRKCGCTLYVILLGGYSLLLHALSGQPDLIVSVPTAGQLSENNRDLVGFLVNMLPLRSRIANGQPLTRYLQSLRSALLEAYEHQSSNVTHLLRKLHPDRQFRPCAVFNLDSADQPMTFADLKMELHSNLNKSAKFEIYLNAIKRPGQIELIWECSKDVINAETALRITHYFPEALEWMVENAEGRISQFSLLTEAERRQIVDEWNDTDLDYDRRVCLHQLVSRRAELSPHAIAAIYEDQRLSYESLERQSNQIANLLLSVGVGRGDFVGLYLSRSAEMIPALLGILKAGASYLPLDLSYPPARVEWILSAMRVKAALTQSWHLPLFEEVGQSLSELRDVICLDRGSLGLEASPGLSWRCWSAEQALEAGEDDPGVEVSSQDIAYVIFTSGSTGTPKGVMVQHQPVVNLIEWVNRSFGIGAEDRGLFVTSLCFDLSVYDVFGLLSAGGSIQIAPDEELREPRRLLERLIDDGVTFWDSAPAALQQLSSLMREADEELKRSRLRLVFLSGDWIPIGLPDEVRTRIGGVEVVALGGATEATVWSNYYRVGEVGREWTSIPYGKPIQNSRYYILDENLNNQPVGVAGDLYIGGECLSVGYINQAEQTATKYIPDEFGKCSGGRLYKTGDLARYQRDGNIEFLGRRDHQVKVRGYRIELGEIECALLEHEGIREAVVAARGEERGEKRVVAYLVSEDGERRGVRELRAHLRERLPEYMIPSGYVWLEKMPVTTNGKLDRAALPEVVEGEGAREQGYMAPSGPMEELLAGIWGEVLGAKEIGANDNFFELGGHSLLAMQMLIRLRNIFQIELPLRSFFESPTLTLLSQMLVAHETEEGSVERMATILQGIKNTTAQTAGEKKHLSVE